jgi:DNA polymerase III epsilon subunit-like protein
MEYVFFDIECACVYKDTAKICAFGYCLTDEQFNIIEKEDLLINPKGKFHLTDRRGKAGLVLPYDYQDFKNYPDFPQVFPRIRKILEGKDKLVFGHATNNDIKYLNLETKRFSLPPFSFAFYDTQLLYMSMIGSFEKQLGLESVAQALNVNVDVSPATPALVTAQAAQAAQATQAAQAADFAPHRAVDDAYVTMRIAQEMCKKEGVSLSELLQKYDVRPGKTSKGNTLNGTSDSFKAFDDERRSAREEREKKHFEFSQILESFNHRKQVKNGVWSGKVFSFSHEIENQAEKAKQYLSVIYSRGGRYSGRALNCDVFVRAQEDNGKRVQNAADVQAEIWEEEQLAQYLEVD